MAKRKTRTRTAPPALTTAEALLKQGLKANPEIELVLEIAQRARALEDQEPARELGMATDIVANPISSQTLW